MVKKTATGAAAAGRSRVEEKTICFSGGGEICFHF
jgi:hypothetical protein